ncbi:MAG: phosphatase PAP2 family protein [Erysipelotrichaceae bacterium]|nr:phosphatase PAP2 family protein [Erysipelotrichaceae bacterium]
MEWEVRIIEWLQSHVDSFAIYLGRLLTFVGGEKGLMIVILTVMFCWKKEVGKKVALILTAMSTWLTMIKAVVKRPRPYLQYPDRVKMLAKVEVEAAADDVAAQGYSFPSMHSASVSLLYFTLAEFVKKKWTWILAVILTLFIAYSRVMVGAHYPTDVLAGLLIGFVSMAIYGLLVKIVKKEWLQNLILFLSALPGLIFVRTQDYYTSLGMLIALLGVIPFEEKYVNYQSTDSIIAKILRVAGSLVVYFALNSLLKLPFSSEFLDSGSFFSLIVRTIRYAIVMFVVLGVYPLIFPLYEKIGKGKK